VLERSSLSRIFKALETRARLWQWFQSLDCIAFTLMLKVRLETLKTVESFPIYHPKVLKKLFIKGYTDLVLKILVQLSKSLDIAHSSPVT
jgi:hypothetical protein